MLSVERSILFAIVFYYQGKYSCSVITDDIQDSNKIRVIKTQVPRDFYFLTDINVLSVLAGVAQWIECRPVNQRVAGWIPSQGTFLDCGPGPQWGAFKRQPNSDVSLPLFLPFSLKMNLKKLKISYKCTFTILS